MADNVEKAKALFFDALTLLEQSNYVASEHKLREALTFAPTSVSILTNLAVALQRQEKYAEAKVQAERAVAVNNANLEALLVLADCCAREEKHTEALSILDRVLAIEPGFADVHNNRGIILAQRGNYAEALACYNRAIEIEPHYSDAQKSRGNALFNLGDYQGALRAYDLALAQRHDPAEIWFERGNVFNRLGKFDEALAAYRSALELNPQLLPAAKAVVGLLLSEGNAAAALQVACKMLDRKRSAETKSLVALCLRACDPSVISENIAPLLLEALSEAWLRPADLAATCIKVLLRNETIRNGMRQAALFASGSNANALTPALLAALAQERLFLALLDMVPVADLALERFLTQFRLHLLTAARSSANDTDEQVLTTYCAVARQCFINGYVFAMGAEERDLAADLRDSLIAALAAGMPIDALAVVAVSAYFPLHALPDAGALLARGWPKPIDDLLAQQISARLEENRLRASMPVLTTITDAVSIAVRDQYEENPYPQWVKLAANPDPKPLDRYFRERFPEASSFTDLHGEQGVDVLVAGCGTGQQSIEAAGRFTDCRVLAVDLSMTSLCYAQRQTHMFGVHNIRYAQADIMKLQETGLTFDVIESTGVLHHLADPLAGWRILLSLLRPNGVMLIALYSEIARRDIVLGQKLVAARGYRATPHDIRKCRAEIIDSPAGSRLRNILAARDFFSLDECRDLLFHAQEHRFTLPQIASFLAENDLEVIGFEVEPQVRRDYLRSFPADISATNLANWHAYETKNPDTFLGMYNFWVRRRRDRKRD